MEKAIEHTADKLGMEKTIKEVVTQFESGDYSELTTMASKIATGSIAAFHGELLRKALAISAAIVDFEDELKKER